MSKILSNTKFIPNGNQIIVWEKGDLQLRAIKEINNVAYRFNGIEIIAVKDGCPLIDNSKPVLFQKEEIIDGTPEKTKKKLSCFNLDVGIDDSKTALELLKKFLEKGKPTDFSQSMNVRELFEEIIDRAISEMETSDSWSLHFRYDRQNDALGIEAGQLKNMLEGSGYNQKSFCNALMKYETVANIAAPLIIKRNKGRCAVNLYSGRYYLFRLEEALIGQEKINKIRKMGR